MRETIDLWVFDNVFTRTLREAFDIKSVKLKTNKNLLHVFPQKIRFFLPNQSNLIRELNKNQDLFQIWNEAFGTQ